jgi:hypothetical protein
LHTCRRDVEGVFKNEVIDRLYDVCPDCIFGARVRIDEQFNDLGHRTPPVAQMPYEGSAFI